MPVSFNRWDYTYSNPVNLTDPAGKFPLECLESNDFAKCLREWRCENSLSFIDNLSENELKQHIKSFGITLEPEEKWTGAWLINLREALFTHIGAAALPSWLNRKPAKMVIASPGTCGAKGGTYGGCTPSTTIYFWVRGSAANPVINMLHEIGHLVDNLSDSGNDFTNQLKTRKFTLDNKYWGGFDGTTYKSIPSHGGIDDVRNVVLINKHFEGQDAWQQRFVGQPHWEDWADIFSNSMIHNINTSIGAPGTQINEFFKEMQIYARSR